MKGLYFSFVHISAMGRGSTTEKKKEKKKKNFLDTDIKQIINNQSKAITSNPEAENNAAEQLR